MDEIKVQEELEFIKKVMEDTKQSFLHDGKPFIVWGLIVIIGQLATYFAIISQNYKYIWYMWGILGVIGWIFSYLDSRKNRSKVKAKSITGIAINAIWLSCGIALTLLCFVAPLFGAVSDGYVNPVAATILGISNYSTGSISYKWLKYVSAGWWLGALIMFIYPGLYTLLFFPGLLLVLQVIPGFIINFQWKKAAIGK